MKKSTMALAAVAAAVLGTTTLGLVACDDEDTPANSEYTITFDANGGAFSAGTTTPVTRKTTDGKLIAFPDDPTVAPSGTDYTFKGWSLKKSGTADDAVSLPMTFSSDKKLYAIWGGEVTDTGAYEITFNPNGGTITSGPSKMTTVNGKLTGTLPTATYGTREFLGWYKVQNSTADADKVTAGSTTFTGITTVFASWGAETPTPVTEKWVTFYGNGGTFTVDGEEETTISLETSNGVISELPTPERDGWQFKGFYKHPTSKDDPFTETTPVTQNNTNVYAHWKELNAAHSGKVTVDGVETELVDNTSSLGTWDPTADDDKDAELMLVSFKPGKDKTLTFTVDGQPIQFYLDGQSTGLGGLAGEKLSSITTLTDGTYTLYIKHYPVNAQHSPARSEAVWVIEGSYTGATEEQREDGIYITADSDYTLVKKLTSNGPGEVKAEHISFETGDVIEIIYDGEPVDITMKPDGTTPNSRKIAKENGELKVVEGGTFTFYLTLNGGYLWVEDESDPEESELQPGDGLYADGTIVKAFEINQGGLNEIKAENVVISEATVLDIKYGGKIITDWTLKEDSDIPQSALSEGKLSLEAATYQFYYDYVNKVMYVGKEGGEDPVGEHTGAFIIDGVETALTNNKKIADTADIELYKTSVSLTAGQVLTFKADGELIAAFYGTNCNGASVNEAAGTVTVTKTSTFDIYLRHYDADDKGNAACWTIEVNNGEVYEALANTYYIVGGMNGWSLAEDCDFTESNGKYTLNIELTDEVQFKVVLSDAEGKFAWAGQKTYTLSSKVATTLTDGNFKITGGDGNYTLTLSGTTVTVTKEGGAPDPSYDKDGVYVGDDLIKEFGEHNANEVKIVKVKFNTNDVLTFVYNSEVIQPKVKTGTGASTKIKNVNGDITCTSGGTFTIYYKFQGGDEGLWIVDEAEEVGSELKAGDGLIAGTTTYAFQEHPNGTNEVKCVGAGGADIVFDAETSFTLKYAGKQVTDFTVKTGSVAGTVTGGVLKLPKGHYNFYYDYVNKLLYIGGAVDIGEIPAGFVQTVKGYQDETHPNVYLVGKFGGLTEVTKDVGKFVAYQQEEQGFAQFTITVTLAVGDVVAIWVPDWNFMCTTAENTVTGKLGTAEYGGETYFTVEKAGTYTFYFKSKSGQDKIYIALP